MAQTTQTDPAPDATDQNQPPRQATQAPPKPRPKKSPPRRKQLPPWKVILHNDQVNEMLHVVQTLVMLTPLNPSQAARRMLEAHSSGKSLLLTTHRERAELYQQQFASRKLTVTVEQDQE